MMRLILIVSIILNTTCTSANMKEQRLDTSINVSKCAIDTALLVNWPKIEMASISADGKYFGYIVKKGNNIQRLVVTCLTRGKKYIESSLKGRYSLSSDNHKIIWLNDHDSLCIVDLPTMKIKYIPNISYFILENEYLTYYDNIGASSTINISSQPYLKTSILASILFYTTPQNKLLLEKNLKNKEMSLVKVLKNGEKETLWTGQPINEIVIDKINHQIAFFPTSNRDSLWYYNANENKVTQLKMATDSGYSVTGLSHFSQNGFNLFVNITSKITINHFLNQKKVKIWSYLDSNLQMNQQAEETSRNYTGMICISNQQLIRLDKDNDWLFLPKVKDTIALIRQQNKKTQGDEVNWNSEANFSWYLMSLRDTSKIDLPSINKNTVIELSPLGKYVIYFEQSTNQYFTYETATGKRHNITSGINENWGKDLFSKNYGKYISSWGENDNYVLINGERDIWLIDPLGQRSPLNLTNGFGNRNNIIFSLALDEYYHRAIHKREKLILSAFNVETKENGFFKIKIGRKVDPKVLTMGSYIYNIMDNPYIPNGINFPPLKALKSKKYILRRMSAIESPNYFVTRNFKRIREVTNINPEKTVNWYKSELYNWKAPNKTNLQGILYKPENFDSTKKYPVILYYYEKRSDGLNAFLEPRLLENGCAINIPYFVSNGYLIFCPDIDYTIGDPMQGTYDAIVSAAKIISTLPYVDSSKIGLQGCSWGGIQTNFLVAHTNIFAAACSASSIENWISNYNSTMKSGENMQGMYEIGQLRIGATLWEKKDIYIKNSAFLFVNNINTPLLLMHTTDDQLFPLQNIKNLFSALRFLKRKSWLLIYEGNHGIWGSNAKDFSVKMKQFFDYYLKKQPMPNWMLE